MNTTTPPTLPCSFIFRKRKAGGVIFRDPRSDRKMIGDNYLVIMSKRIAPTILVMGLLTGIVSFGIFFLPRYALHGERLPKGILTTKIFPMELVRGIEEYRRHYGHYPPLENPPLFLILAGQNINDANPQAIAFIAPLVKNQDYGRFLTKSGQVVDYWRNPFRTFVENDEIVIVSNGPNKVDDLMRNDDIVIRSQGLPRANRPQR